MWPYFQDVLLQMWLYIWVECIDGNILEWSGNPTGKELQQWLRVACKQYKQLEEIRGLWYSGDKNELKHDFNLNMF